MDVGPGVWVEVAVGVKVAVGPGPSVLVAVGVADGPGGAVLVVVGEGPGVAVGGSPAMPSRANSAVKFTLTTTRLFPVLI